MPEESARFTAEKEDFRMRYQVCIEDIKYVKSRGWAITYYLLSLYAGIFYISYVLNNLCNEFKNLYAYILVCFLWLTFIAGSYFLIEFHFKNVVYRIRRQIIIKNLSWDFRKFENYVYEEGYTNLGRDKEYTLTFIILLFGGAVLVNMMINYFGDFTWLDSMPLYGILFLVFLDIQDRVWSNGCRDYKKNLDLAEKQYGIKKTFSSSFEKTLVMVFGIKR